MCASWTYALKRSQLPSTKERRYICEQLVMFYRQGFFTAHVNRASAVEAPQRCFPLPGDMLNENVLIYLRDDMNRRARPHGKARRAYDVLYQASFEARDRARLLTDCINDITLNVESVEGRAKVKQCTLRYGSSGSAGQQPVRHMCFVLHNPPASRDMLHHILQCDTSSFE